MPHLWRQAGAFLLVAALGAGMFFSVKARYGSYGDYYFVNVDVPRIGQLMRVGADVRERGVIIGTVSDIALRGHEARMTLRIEDEYRVPSTARAVVSLKTLLGDKFVDLRFEDFSPPYLRGGETIAGSVGPELEDALESGVEVLTALNPDDAAEVIHELATASRGHGEDIARGIDANADLSTTFAITLDPQLRGLRAFRVLFQELRTRAEDLNELADAVNEGAPVYASDRAREELRRVLTLLVPMSNHLADLLILDRASWDRMMDSGDRVLQTIADRPQGLADLVHGAYRYVFKLSPPPPPVGDGREMAPFAALIGGEDEESNREGGPGSAEEFVDAIRDLCDLLPRSERREIEPCRVADR
jgi:virulence factor Mce-like protein